MARPLWGGSAHGPFRPVFIAALPVAPILGGMTFSADTPDSLSARAVTILEKLVAFDTVSRHSNLALVEYVERRFAALGITPHRVPNAVGDKTNLFATLGPDMPGGLVLSGHTDVVPVDGQDWSSDPFAVTRRDDRLYGRGTCDMKAFIALALAAAPDWAATRLKRPVHFAFSYDEEVGCAGAPAMIDRIAARLPAPAAVIVGEPTNMQVVSAHKGITSYRVTVTGHEAHSSLTHLGISANMVAVELMHRLGELAKALAANPPAHSHFLPPHPTLTIGMIHGGTAVNILARKCEFMFDLRCPPGFDPDELLAPFLAKVERLDTDMKARFAETGVVAERMSHTPPLAPEPGSNAEAIIRALAQDDENMRAVPYAAEGGLFQRAGMATVICGPGSIEQAHQPDEFIEISQIDKGAAFMQRLGAWLASGE